MKKILVIQTAFLGDVILSTPLISELRRLFPEATIDVLVKKGNEGLLANNSKIRHVYTLDKSNGKWRSISTLIRTFRTNKYDLLINLHRFGSSGIISVLSGAKEVCGFDKNPFSRLYHKRYPHRIGDGTHEVSRNLSIIQDLGGQALIRPEIFPSEEDKRWVETFQKKPYLVIAPASVWFTKQLPESKWVEICNQTEDLVFIIGAASDSDLAERIRVRTTNPQVVNLCGQLSLLQSAALMKGAIRCHVNDSGPLHLASAVNAPVTAYFCSTIPSFGFGPLSDDSKINEVKGLTCRPCGIHGHRTCPEGHFRCGNEQSLS